MAFMFLAGSFSVFGFYLLFVCSAVPCYVTSLRFVCLSMWVNARDNVCAEQISLQWAEKRVDQPHSYSTTRVCLRSLSPAPTFSLFLALLTFILPQH